MSAKILDRNLAPMSQTLLSLILMGAAPMTNTWMEEGIVLRTQEGLGQSDGLVQFEVKDYIHWPV